MAEERFCRYCGAEITGEGRFCRSCGKELAPQKPKEMEPRRCRQCGNALSASAQFCKICGTPVNAPEEETAVPSAQTEEAKPKRAAARKAAEPKVKEPEKKDSQPKTQPKAQPKVQPKSQPKSRQKKSGRSIPTRLIAAVLVIVLLFTAFVEPGFLRHKGGNGGGYDGGQPYDVAGGIGTQGNSGIGGYSAGEEITVTPDNAPGAPQLMDVKISREEVERVEPEVAEVSPEEPYGFCGDVRVDFKSWNLESDEDTFEVRRLGSRQTSDGEYEIEVYDFSLASGQHEFDTNVDVWLPRPQDGSADGVVYFNEETQTWEPTAYEISDSGEYYILHTTHFSVDGVRRSLIRQKMKEYTEGDDLVVTREDKLFWLNASEAERAEAHNYDVLKYRLYLNDEAIHNLILRAYTESDDEIPEFEAYMKDVKASVSQSIKDMMAIEGAADATNTSYAFCEYLAVAAAKGGKANDPYSDTFLGASVALTGGQMLVEALNGKRWWTLLKENSRSLASICVGFLGKVKAVSNIANWNLYAAVISLAIYAVPEAYVALEDQILYENGMPPQNVVYRKYLNDYTYDRSGKYKLNLYGRNWKKVLEARMLENLDDQDAAANVVKEEFDTYINHFWDWMTIRERARFNNEVYGSGEMGNVTDGTGRYFVPQWSEPDDEQIRQMKAMAEAQLKAKTEEIVNEALVTYLCELERKLKFELYAKVIPRMNAILFFEAKDKDLEKDQTFDKSPYARKNTKDDEGPSIWFQRKSQEVEMWPANTFPAIDYDAETFYPVAAEGKNTIFICRYYNYLQMDMPTVMKFAGNPDENLPPAKASVSVPHVDDLKTYNYIELVLEPEEIKGDVWVLDEIAHDRWSVEQFYDIYDPDLGTLHERYDQADYEAAVERRKREDQEKIAQGKPVIHLYGVGLSQAYYDYTVTLPDRIVTKPEEFQVSLNAPFIPGQNTPVKLSVRFNASVGSLKEPKREFRNTKTNILETEGTLYGENVIKRKRFKAGDHLYMLVYVNGYQYLFRYTYCSMDIAEQTEINYYKVDKADFPERMQNAAVGTVGEYIGVCLERYGDVLD